MPCRSDTDCADWVGTCGSGGFCDLPTLSVVEDQYLNCYIDQMSSVLEDYLRREVLGGELEDAPKTSSEFFDALRLAASEGTFSFSPHFLFSFFLLSSLPCQVPVSLPLLLLSYQREQDGNG